MRIPYHLALEEEVESPCEEEKETVISGRIYSKRVTLVRYLASWTGNLPANNVFFDLIFTPVTELPSSWYGEAVSLVHSGVGYPRFIDASKRPFAHVQAKLCKFPRPAITSGNYLGLFVDVEAESDLVVNSVHTVDFIIQHDSRLVRCFHYPT